jgi:N-acetylmuramoyl-L-alanine amidase
MLKILKTKKSMQKIFKHLIFQLFIAIIVLNPTATMQAQQKKFKVVIDAGHGGKDSGTTGTGKYKKNEKDVALAVALLVNKKLKAYNDIKPILTRKSDVFLELYQRANIANRNKADLFISIHCNANNSKSPKGSETYVLGVHRNKANLEVVKRENAVIQLESDHKLHYEGFDPKHPESFISLTILQEEFLDQSILFASMIQDFFKKNNNHIKDRSVQQAGFAVLRLTYMPSVLTEIGFLSNPKEEKKLQSKKGQDEIAKSIVKAILAYKRYIRINTPSEAEKYVKSETPQPKKKIVKTTAKKTIAKNEVAFFVQIAASRKKLNSKSSFFKGLKNVSMKRINGWYKYYIGNTSSFQKAKSLQALAKQKSFKDAFIVAYKNGKRVKLSEILKKK